MAIKTSGSDGGTTETLRVEIGECDQPEIKEKDPHDPHSQSGKKKGQSVERKEGRPDLCCALGRTVTETPMLQFLREAKAGRLGTAPG